MCEIKVISMKPIIALYPLIKLWFILFFKLLFVYISSLFYNWTFMFYITNTIYIIS